MEMGNGIELEEDTWQFSQAAAHFDEHIKQSVPNCEEQRKYVAALARFFLHQDGRAYELGVSTGRTAEAVLARMPGRKIQYIGLDLEPEMVAKARVNLAGDPRFIAACANVLDYAFEPAALVISYYTFQFLPPVRRPKLLRRLWETLEPGGALVVYEKTLGSDPKVQCIFSEIYHEFKAQQGLSADAILNKERSLQGVAQPMTLEENFAQLRNAGFETVEIIFRSFCFAGFLAVKDRQPGAGSERAILAPSSGAGHG